MEVSKIRLSPSEKEMVSSAAMILTKNSIIKKAIGVLEIVQDEITRYAGPFDWEIFRISPKISKGENYEGLPYAILDYPRLSKNNDLFFCRTMFWWGNFFSSTLHVSGDYKKLVVRNSDQVFRSLANRHFYIGIGTDPWVHHFGKENYQALSEMRLDEFKSLIDTAAHIKIAAKFPLDEWENAAILLSESWRDLIYLVTQPVE
jgi:hypothetical protein